MASSKSDADEQGDTFQHVSLTSDNNNVKVYSHHDMPKNSGMTPSIITTINNTSPHPPPITKVVADNASTSNTNTPTATRNKRPSEPYESYIEDSFVGHWEREDDDDDDDYRDEHDDVGALAGGRHGVESELHHPSTIEFDFDSFGPESFIYTPSSTATNTESNGSNNNRNHNHNHNHNSADQPQQGRTLMSELNAAILEETQAECVTPTLEQQQTSIASQQQIINSDSALTTTRTPSPSTGTPTVAPQNRDKDNVVAAADPAALSDKKENEDESKTNNERLRPRLQSSSSEDNFNAHSYALNVSPHDERTQIDLKVIEPYKKVISHAGYCHHFDSTIPAPKPGEPAPAVIVFSACYLPDRSRRDYNYVMDHLFLYVLLSLHELIADDYILIYLHNTSPSSSSTGVGQQQNNLPTFTWMKRCYQMIDHKLRKNLKILYLVRPTFWLKTIIIMCRPFISAKFSKKLRFVENMDALKKCVPVDELILPASAANI